jgi:hypothetical protein
MKHFASYFFLVLFCTPFFGGAQSFALPQGQKNQKIKFQLINNLIVIPIEVNGTELSFILDSGVSKPILFNLTDEDAVQINNVSEITIRGLGEGEPIQALSSSGNSFKLKNIRNDRQLLYVVLDRDLNFSPALGIPVHGIIGYDLFRDFIVDVNYTSKTIKFHDPNSYKYKSDKRAKTLPLSIMNRKAYIDGQLFLKEESELPVRLLIDTGSSDAVWLFEDELIDVPVKNYEDFLGEGLNGSIFGKRTKVSSINLGPFALKNAKAAFPRMESFGAIKNLSDRNGSLGGEILKRFNIVFDYPNSKITFKKNGHFKAPFHYNLSGITLQHDGVRYVAQSIADSRGLVYKDESTFGNVKILMENRTKISVVPEIVVSGIRAGSPAHEAGLREGDVVLTVNGKSVHRYKLQEVTHMLDEQEGKKVRVMIERANSDLKFSFTLKKMFRPIP